MKKILVVEDNQELSEMIKTSLTKEYFIIQAFSGTESIYMVKDQSVDLILLDLMLPGLNGEEVIIEIRKITNCPIIVMSAISNSDKVVEMFGKSANDFISKPFDINVLKARIENQLRSYKQSCSSIEIITYGDFKLIINEHTLEYKNKFVSLSNKEFKFMELLLSNPKHIFSKSELYSIIWEDEYMFDENTINVHISGLRKKIKKYCDVDCIETVWGMGIRMK